MRNGAEELQKEWEGRVVHMRIINVSPTQGDPTAIDMDLEFLEGPNEGESYTVKVIP